MRKKYDEVAGHADNLAKAQKEEVQFIIHTLPIVEYMDEISKTMGNGFNLFSGTSAETSGGLLMAVDKDKVRRCILHFIPAVREMHLATWTVKIRQFERHFELRLRVASHANYKREVFVGQIIS